MPYRSAFLFVLILSLSACSLGRDRVDAGMLGTSHASLDRPIDFDRIDDQALSEAIVSMTNAVRERHGVAKVSDNRVLRRAAAKYAKRMVDKEFLAHEDPFDARMRTPADRVKAAGGKNALPAENIADVPAFRLESGQPFYLLDPSGPVISLEPEGEPVARHTYATYAATVVEGWMNSPGHRKNLLNADALEVGVGAAMYLQNHVPTFIVVQKFQLYDPLAQ